MNKFNLAGLFLGLFVASGIFAQSTISGKVKDIKGNPVAGVSVTPKDAQKGTTTDSTGSFTIKTNPGGSLTFTAIGYADTVVLINFERSLVVVLRQKTNTLQQVTVSSGQAQSTELSNQVINELNIQNTLDNYVKSEQLGAGVKSYSGLTQSTAGGLPHPGSYNVTTTAYMGSLNVGSLVPVYHEPAETKGSRFIMSDWSPGLVVNQFDTIIKNDSYVYNFDKVAGDLLMTQDRKTYIDIDRANVKSFALKGPNGGYVFERVPLLDPSTYFEVLGKGQRYAAYKAIKTKFVKANGQANGLTSVGNDYDEYVDQFDYFFIDLKTKEVRRFELKKKSIRDAVGDARDRADKYMADHKRDEIDDKFVNGLVNFLNS